MGKLFDHASSALTHVLAGVAGRAYAYQRADGEEFDLTAVRTRPRADMTDADDAAIEYNAFDFLLPREALLAPGDTEWHEPVPGDAFYDAVGVQWYDVLRGPSGRTWRPCDGNSVRIRIHTKLRYASKGDKV